MWHSVISGCVLWFVCQPAGGHGTAGRETGRIVTRRVVSPGITLIRESVAANATEGPLSASLLLVDLKRSGVRVTAALGGDRVWGTDPTSGREIVSAMAKRRRAVAAVNAGFFPLGGNPIGLHIQDGEIVTEPGASRTCLLIDRGNRARLDAFSFAGQAVAKTKGRTARFSLSGMNRRPGAKEALLLFTPTFAERTLKQPARTEVVLAGIRTPILPNRTYAGRVKTIGQGGESPLSKNTVVLSGIGPGAAFLRRYALPGRTLSFRPGVSSLSGRPVRFTDIRTAVSGGPRLIRNGKVTIRAAAEGFSSGFAVTRHPRTAAGITRDGKLLLAVVDGRRKTVSRGMSLSELAALLLKYDTRDAVNLDGGGSSVMIVHGRVVNTPSDGRERPVANALLVFGPDSDKKSGRVRAKSAARRGKS